MTITPLRASNTSYQPISTYEDLYNAIQDNDLDKIKSIINKPNNKKLIEEEIKQYFLVAAKENRTEVLDIFMASTSYPFITSKSFSYGLNLALEKSYNLVIDIITKFANEENLPLCTFKYTFLCDAFRYALKNNWTNFIEVSTQFIKPEELIQILKNEDFIDESKNLYRALQLLLNKNLTEVAKAIINSEKILSFPNYKEAFKQTLSDKEKFSKETKTHEQILLAEKQKALCNIFVTRFETMSPKDLSETVLAFADKIKVTTEGSKVVLNF